MLSRVWVDTSRLLASSTHYVQPIAIQPQHIKSRNQSPAHHPVGVGLHAQPGLSGYDYKTNHRKPSQTTTNYRKPPQTTSNDHKPPPEFETIDGENDEKQANHRKPPQTTANHHHQNTSKKRV